MDIPPKADINPPMSAKCRHKQTFSLYAIISSTE
jgi:hypothetical protein